MDNLTVKYFLASNSCEGFVSTFKDCYNAADGWRAYIIKGGPGTGKSSFMKYMMAKAQDKGISAELFPCSSDPDSLDAVIFKEMKTVIMDGTAPHTVDPDYPGVCETILNFGEFWNEACFVGEKKEILSVTDKNKRLHKSAARYIKAVGSLMEDNLKIAALCTDNSKVKSFADRLCKRYIPQKGGKPYEWVRFLSGITPKGVVSYGGTVLNSCKTAVVIEDEIGTASDMIMRKIRDFSLKQGYEIITVKNAFLPSELTDHIIIPELSLCFMRESEYQHFSTDMRRIHSRRFVNSKQLHKSKERLKFNKKAIRQLLYSACAILSEAKTVHDQMEKYYIEAMDFNSLTEFANSFAEKLFTNEKIPRKGGNDL